MPGLPFVRNRLSFGGELRKTRGARAGANRTRLQTPVVLARCERFGVSKVAAVSRANRDGGKTSAVLPACRLANRRQGHWNSETTRTGGARPAAAPGGQEILF